jgi:hypothetical protein
MTLTTSWKVPACLFPEPKEKAEAEINPQRAESWITLMQVASLEETCEALELPPTWEMLISKFPHKWPDRLQWYTTGPELRDEERMWAPGTQKVSLIQSRNLKKEARLYERNFKSLFAYCTPIQAHKYTAVTFILLHFVTTLLRMFKYKFYRRG